LTRPASAANRTPGELALRARESSGQDGRPVTSWPHRRLGARGLPP